MKSEIEIERYLGFLSKDIEELKRQQDKILLLFDEANKKNVFDLNECYENHQIIENITIRQECDERLLNKPVERKKDSVSVKRKKYSKKVIFGRIKDGLADFFDFIKDCISSLVGLPNTTADLGEIFCIIIASFATAYNALFFLLGYSIDDYTSAVVCLVCGIVGMLCFIPTIVKFFKEEGNWFGFIYSFFELALLIGDIVWFCALFNS